MIVTCERFKRLLFYAIGIFVLIFVMTKLINSPKKDPYRNTKKNLDPNVKTILLWNPFFGDRNWGLNELESGNKIFQRINCTYTNCFVTSNKIYLESIDQFDAILFHTVHSSKLVSDLPAQRSGNQLYVYVNNESPANTDLNLWDSNFFNWTLTFRLDSDVMNYYGHVEDLETKQFIAPKRFPKWRDFVSDFKLDERTEKLIAGKTKMAAWFVSNCNTKSRRELIVRSLKKIVQVDTYGSCGPLKCPRFSDICDTKLNTQYKFYLAFENSLCNDYVTEKLFWTMERTVVPIVYGGANYTKFAPPHSYINVEDFKSVSELAEYLMFLDKNPEEYRKYFWWKNFYKIDGHNVDIPFCEICMKLNNPLMTTKVQYYADVEEWFSKDQCRKDAEIEF